MVSLKSPEAKSLNDKCPKHPMKYGLGWQS